jgi:hypothetical protein
MPIDRKFADDVLESYFGRLGKAEQYARQHWLFLTGRGHKPDENPNIPANDRQEIRIRLAQSI